MFVTRGVLMEYFKNSYGLEGWKKKKEKKEICSRWEHAALCTKRTAAAWRMSLTAGTRRCTGPHAAAPSVNNHINKGH